MKILITHASAGAGHTKAAEALFNYLKSKTSHHVVFVDALDYTNKLYKYIYQTSYKFLITKLPGLWGFFFWLTDIRFLIPFVRLCRRVFNIINACGFHRYLKKEQFDAILSTHFFPNEVAGHLIQSKAISSSLISVVTDYDAHSIWISPGIDFYAVACEQTKRRLVSLGIEGSKIVITGIPTDERFSKGKDIKALKDKLKIKKNIFTVLIATGSFGIGPIEKIVAGLKDYQVLVVCGGNQKLFQRLKQKSYPHAVIFGLVNNMYELMAVSHCMVTKPGGLSISEALVTGLPLIFFNAIPGQEEGNVRVLNGLGIGFQSRGDIDLIVREVKKLSQDKEKYAVIQKKIAKLARPQAVETITEMI